ncbi:hypothetical protein GCM10022211_15630 [Sphingomonas humi]|uniref:Uncharacterized protein n=1 Tax=Sphingomonas humi TaxID=335630 RepID=A0ABP7RZN0_9SPHN
MGGYVINLDLTGVTDAIFSYDYRVFTEDEGFGFLGVDYNGVNQAMYTGLKAGSKLPTSVRARTDHFHVSR